MSGMIILTFIITHYSDKMNNTLKKIFEIGRCLHYELSYSIPKKS